MTDAIIVGIDEAGRGPLAGPVVAGACHIPHRLIEKKKGCWHPETDPSVFLCDSKQMEEHEREAAYEWIVNNCPWGVGLSTAFEIDTIGIMASNEQAMQKALATLAETITPTYLLVDGRDKYWFDYPHSSIIGGDALEPSIAAASIIAKVTRDRMMKEYAQTYPEYGFEGHKGYASPAHVESIQKYGPCDIHRKTYLRNILTPSASTGTQRARLG